MTTDVPGRMGCPVLSTHCSPTASVSTTCRSPVTVRGPRFCTPSVDDIMLSLRTPVSFQTGTSNGDLDLLMSRSAPSGMMVRPTVPLLLIGTGSGVVALIRAVLLTTPLLLAPVEGTCAVMVMIACAPGAKLPARVQVRTLALALLVQVQPAGALPPVITKPSGIASVTTTPVAALGPSLRAVRVYVTTEPAAAGAGDTDLDIARSAPAVTAVVTCAALLSGTASGTGPALTTAALTMLPVPTLTLPRNW